MDILFWTLIGWPTTAAFLLISWILVREYYMRKHRREDRKKRDGISVDEILAMRATPRERLENILTQKQRDEQILSEMEALDNELR